MLFFRSEDMVRRWCAERGHVVRPLVRMDQLWSLATAWYASRLESDARRPRPDEAVAIFTRLDLTGAFWDPRADRF